MALMKNTYRLYKRHQIYYAQHNQTGKQESLRTKDKDQAKRRIAAKNEIAKGHLDNLEMAKQYLRAADPNSAKRTWRDVVDEGRKTKHGSTLERWERAFIYRAFDVLLKRKLIETRTEHFNDVFSRGTATTNMFLRRLHNLALDLDWNTRPVVPKKRWPVAEFKEKREEFQKIIAGERIRA
jgi:hypothetical protein